MQIDGVDYAIDWENFTVGSSFFVPCLRDEEGRQRIERKMNRLGYKVLIKIVIEDEIRGLRVWRISRYNEAVG
jgi:hypothetical protein